ncbi:ROK family transcriptional regulator [Virgibacillus siamensis]|uniref:ROK family transcriptional regulator n=1 Tax=Virgibacillus siamensis TaxID=480071 RepID=UPI00098648A6|nr:ROK family protein [Virgibacillus siamensis]
MNTGGASYIKKINKKILVEEIIKNISLSRSDLARITGLNKATVSAQVSDLMNDYIVIEKNAATSKAPGRKPIILEINENAGYSIGIDIDDVHLKVIFNNLKGKSFHKLTIDLKTFHFDHVINLLIDNVLPFIEKFNLQYKQIGLVGVGVGIHGIVSNNNEIIFTPKQQWSHINIKSKLEEVFKANVHVDNNANLSAFAEQAYFEQIPDLFCITLHSGIGLGIINGNKIYRGYQGFAGEIGHMIINSGGEQCSCGNNGCWELYASENSLVKKLTNKFPLISLPDDIEKLRDDNEFEAILDEYFDYLAAGLNNIINIFNPEKIILNGSIINGNSPFIGNVRQRLKSRMNNFRDIKASNLGEDACALGGAVIALRNFFGVNLVDYTAYDYFRK